MNNEVLTGYTMSDKAEIDDFKKIYKPYYSKGGSNQELGLKGLKGTSDKVEEYAVNILDNKQSIDARIFLWKAGRLEKKDLGEEVDDGLKIQNGRGFEINNAKKFIDTVKDDLKIVSDSKEDFQGYYEYLLNKSKESQLKNVGAVYLITVLFFLSKGTYPIYDYYAHRAVKALFLNKKPCEVFVGAAPDKAEKDKVIAMYIEYCYLLEKVFGRKNIERDLDQALWVYGHATERFK